MQSYITPKCQQTLQPAQLFCCSSDCSQPAFACSQSCLLQHTHTPQMREWNTLSQQIRKALHIELTKEDVQSLEKQDKKILIISQELRILQLDNWRALCRCRQKLHPRDIVGKVLAGISNKDTDWVSGNDMARFVRLLELEAIFANQTEVDCAVAKRNELMDGLIQRIRDLLEEYKLKMSRLKSQQEMSSSKQSMIYRPPQFEKQIILIDGMFTVEAAQVPNTFPVFLKDPITVGQSFQVEIVDAADRDFYIGVVTARLRDSINYSYGDQGSYCVWGKMGRLYAGDNVKMHGFRLETGDRITIAIQLVQTWRKTSVFIQWIRGGNLLCQASVSKKAQQRSFLPVCWLANRKNPIGISKLRYV